LSGTPYKGHIFLDEVMKWTAYLGEILDEALVEIGESNETSDFFEFCGWGPNLNGFHLDWVHGNFAGTDDQSEIADMGLFKLTLLRSEI
jgi:hypothetical protein